MNLNNIDLNKLKVFQVVMSKGNYAQASEELNLTRSAISQSITTLEFQLDTQLFLRKSKKMIPTEKAKLLFEVFSSHQRALLGALDKVAGSARVVEGTVHIGAYLEFAKTRLMPVLQKFMNTHCDVHVQFLFDSPSRLQQLLVKNKLDMSFSIFPVKGVKQIESTRVYAEELIMIAPKVFSAKLQSYEKLIQLPMIDYFPNHSAIYRWINCHYGRRPKNLPIKMYASTAEMVIESVKAGLGIGVVPNFLFESEPDSNMLRVIRPTSQRLVDFIWLNQFKNQFSSLAHQEFYNLVLDTFGRST